MIGRIAILVCGLAAYLASCAAIAYLAGFSGNLWAPRSVDRGPALDTSAALLVDVAALALFGIQHSLMARQGFKRWLRRWVPAALERPTYLLAMFVALAVLFWAWRPVPRIVWSIEDAVWTRIIWFLCGTGWLLMLGSSYLVDHYELMGLRQVWAHSRGSAFQSAGFREVGAYRYSRHPMMLGFLVAFWSVPVMTLGHLVFSMGMSLYIVVGVLLEERDLLAAHGEAYRKYRSRVARFLPMPWRI